MTKTAVFMLVTLLLGILQCQISSGQQRGGQSELREMRDAFKKVEKDIGQISTSLGGIDTKLGQISGQVSQVAARPAGMTTFELLLILLTLAYSIGTFLLWWTTSRQVRIAMDQLRVATDQVQLANESTKLARDSYEQAKNASIAATLQQLGANDRSIKSLLVQDPTIYSPMEPRIDPLGGRDRPVEERRLKAYLGLVINHVKHVFLQDRLGQLPANYWEAVDRDLDASVQVPEFREVWERVGRFQPSDFRAYVDGKMRRVEEERKRG